MTIEQLSGDERESLTQQLCEERDYAVKKRKSKGLDAIWANARARYEGKEPSTTTTGSFEKGETLDGPLTVRSSASSVQTPNGSSVVLNITRPYVNAGTAMVSDILLQSGKLPFSLRPTPVSDAQTILRALEDYPEVMPLLDEIAPELVQRMGVEEDSETGPAAQALILIEDWLKEANWDTAIREQVMESGKVGTGVVKGPFPQMRKMSSEVDAFLAALPGAFTDPNKGLAIQQGLLAQLQYTPGAEIVKAENCYPDPGCGSDIQNGRFFYEHVPETTRRQLKDYKDDPAYDSDQIDACLLEGPKVVGKGDKEAEKGPFELWVRTGTLTLKGSEETQDFGFQVTVMCNKRIIKSEAYWLESQTFPYWVLPWLPRDGCWTGIGIAEQAETPQRGVTAAVRALMDNMGYSVGPQVLEMEGLIEPVNGNWDLVPYKRWTVKAPLPGVDAVREAKEALTFLEFPNYLNEIMPTIDFWLKMTEDTTGLSLLLQGKAVTEAVGVSQQLMNNATTVLRQVVKSWDSGTCRPQISSFYEWSQLYGPEEVKGDAVVEPLGSSSLIIRELQQQALMQLGDKAVQPIYGLSPSKWMKLTLEGFQMNYEQLKMTEEERQQLAEAENTPDPKIQVAQIEAAADIRIAQMKRESEDLQIALKAMQDEFTTSQAEHVQRLENLAEAAGLLQTVRKTGEEQPDAAPAPAPAPSAEPSPEEVENALAQLEGGQL